VGYNLEIPTQPPALVDPSLQVEYQLCMIGAFRLQILYFLLDPRKNNIEVRDLCLQVV